jgi:long-chain acyl-CoA synthetase
MGKVLLTGATGFIGGELLRRLLRRDARPIVCLVRASGPAEAARRGADTLAALFGGRAAPTRLAARVEWIAADVERPRLGLDDATFDALAGEVDEVFHCAASTRFDLPLDEARRINVDGVVALHALCEAACARPSGGFRRLHHVSTAYVAGKTPGEVHASDLPDDDPALFRNTYERTKAEAERFLRAGMDRVPTTVYRPSIVVGDSRTGKTTSWNVVYYPMRLMAWGRLPYASVGGRALLDVVPVDHVVEGLLALAAREDTCGGTYHLTAGEDALTVHDVIRHTYAGLARRRRRPVPVGTRALGPLPWALLTGVTRLLGGAAARRALDGFSVYVDYTRCDTSFSTARERALLAEAGVGAPDPEAFFPVIVDTALAENFGRPWPRQAPTPRPAPAAGIAALATA